MANDNTVEVSKATTTTFKAFAPGDWTIGSLIAALEAMCAEGAPDDMRVSMDERVIVASGTDTNVPQRRLLDVVA